MTRLALLALPLLAGCGLNSPQARLLVFYAMDRPPTVFEYSTMSMCSTAADALIIGSKPQNGAPALHAYCIPE